MVTVDSDEQGVKLVRDLRQLLQMSGFNLTKWASTSSSIMSSIPNSEKLQNLQNAMPGESLGMRVLGISWNVSTDEFRFSVDLPEHQVTKRQMLFITNSLYDPLGFVAPVVVEARLIYSAVCQTKIGWDEVIDSANLKRWESWKSSIQQLKNVRIPRCFKPNICDGTKIQLQLFSDASSVARGVVCYLRTVYSDSSATCRLVMGKGILAGSRNHTIPRLELEAALDAVNMFRMIKQELELPSECPCFFWTDSMIVLQSLRAETKKFSIFPRNRLQRILSHTKVHDWFHVSSEENLADQASRGVSAKTLLKTGTWLNGPDFLRNTSEERTVDVTRPDLYEKSIYKAYDLISQVKSFVSAAEELTGVDRLMAYFSSWHKLKISTAWMLRFKSYLLSRMRYNNREPPAGEISIQELDLAESELIKFEQTRRFPNWIKSLSKGEIPHLPRSETRQMEKLSPILVEGIMRVGGRINNADLPFDARHPIILPAEGYLTKSIIVHYHEQISKHMGENYTLNLLSQRYWIINPKATIRRVIKQCLVCHRKSVKPGEQMMSDLPKERLDMRRVPFFNTGVDFFGPLMVRRGRSELKRYGCLFTCLTTRAIHLEVTPDLTTNSFINALRRFIARRGQVRKIISDNGSNIVGCHNTLKQGILQWNQQQIHHNLRQRAIEWKFNPPCASHMGGIWERMIRTVRQILLNILPSRSLDDDCLLTLMVEVEDIVNSRPLTEVNPEAEGNLPLTPNHLLRLNVEPNLPPMNTDEKNGFRAADRFRQVQFLADKF